MSNETPPQSFHKDIPGKLDYPDCSMTEMVFKTTGKYPDMTAYEFIGCKKTYRELVSEIELCARGLVHNGISKGDRVTISMPNTPQAVIMFYAVNLIGGVANMVHPLSAENEMVRYINESRSVAIFTLDQFAGNILSLLPRTNARTLITASVSDGLSGIMKPLYMLTKGRTINRLKTSGSVLRYKDLLKQGARFKGEHRTETNGSDVAVILYSGGTSGETKGILLTNLNMNALGLQTLASADCISHDTKMLAIMPIFHGFGLGVCIHTVLIYGARSILVPQFSLKEYEKLLKKAKPHYIAGVPTLYEAMLRMKGAQGLDMSQLRGVFSGGDTLTVELKRKVDSFLQEHGCSEQIREGYGLTETVTASCLTPRTYHKEGSIGIPYPDMLYKIVKPGSHEELETGQEGEIVISGPTVMKGYDNNEEETAKVLQTHPDGRVWVHTGDLGKIDADGFVYFKMRMKRMIISSGYSIYPAQLENAIESHEKVLISCVIGVPDEYRKQRVKAYIVLKDSLEATDEIKQSILEHCKKNIAKYAMPREFEYRSDLPRTLVGKVAYAELEREVMQ